MSIKVINAGMLTTVQDAGRYGMQASGMQVSGCMDTEAAALANLLVGNDESAGGLAVLECTYLGAELELEDDALLAVTGGLPDVQLDSRAVQPYKAIVVRAGQRFKVGAQKKGMRAYIAAAGGFAVDDVFSSRSTNLKLGIGGYQGRKLAAGDELPVGDLNAYARKALAGGCRLRQADIPVDASELATIHIVLGPQEDYFSKEEIEKFTQEIYTISSESDRMGYRLEGRAVEKIKQQDLITDGIALGSIQIPPNGQPIIMLADHQTTGGYPKLATVATIDLPKLAQLMPGARLQFELVSVQEAQRALREQYQKRQVRYAEIKAAAEKKVFSTKAKKFNLKINNEAFEVIVEPI